MTLKYKIIGAFVVILVSFASGRYSAPQSVKIETKTAETDNKKTDTNIDKQNHTKTVIVDTKNKDGTETKTTTITHDSDTKTDVKMSQIDTKFSDTTKDIEYKKSRLTVSALACSKVSVYSSTFTVNYGMLVQKDLIGPINVGAFGLSNGEVGVSAGISF